MWLGKFGFDRIRESDAEGPFINSHVKRPKKTDYLGNGKHCWRWLIARGMPRGEKYMETCG